MQALKDVALRLLNVYVSPYVDNLNAQDLSVSVFGGNLQFHGLHLKKSLLERFGLPIEIVAGDIGNLSVTIPWTQLKTQPVKIVIDDVYVLARARPPGKVDPEEDERIEQATKQDKLKSAEAVDNAASQVGAPGNDESKQTYIGAIVSKVVDNVQIHVKGIHVRYEDGTSTPEHPFAAGLSLDEFKAVSTDENWVEAFIHDSVKGVHKLVKLSALSVYFDTDTGSIDKGSDDRQGTIDALKEMLASPPTHQYILKPVTGEARAIMNHHMSRDTPKVDAQVIFDEIGVVFDRDQYRDALSVLDVFHFFRRTHRYHKFRPPEEDFKANPARARLKFALNAIGAEVHERHRRWTWDYLAERRDTRKKYVELYVKKLALPEGKLLPAEEGTTLAEMERKLSYEDIRFFRSVARAKAKEDAATRRKLEAERRKDTPQRQTWGQWIWGTGGQSSENGGMSAEEKKEIDDIIDYDAAVAAAASPASTPKDYMRARMSARLNKGSFVLRTNPHGQNNDIISLVFDSFTADGVQLTESVKGKIALGGFRVYDGTNPNSLHPQIVRVKDIEANSRSRSRQASLPEEGTEEVIEEISDCVPKDEDPFFVMEVEQNPLDGRADSALTVKMRHLEIIYHPGYVEAVFQFFKPPASQLESINALLDAAGQTLDGIRKETRAGLEYALEQHKTVDIKVDMNAPIIVIPMDVTVKDCQTLVLDAGHIAVESKLADKDQLHDVQSKRGREYNEDDYKQLEDLMYDSFLLRLESTQVLIGNNIESCMQTIEHPSNGVDTELHILERINMSFTVQNAIVNAPNLTRFKITGDLPELRVNFSDRKYKSLMKFIDVAIPKFGDDEAVEKPSRSTGADHQSFRPQRIEEYNLDDTHSISSHPVDQHDDDNKSNNESATAAEHFYPARDDTTETQRRALRQVTFQFSFTVGRLQTSLFRSISASMERPLADASLVDFGLTFSLRKYDMSVDLYLRSLALAMIEPDRSRRGILSSAGDGNESASDVKLVQVKYFRVQKDSPEFMTKYEGVDQSIDTELSTFKITCAPEPIISLYDFIMTTFVPKNDASIEQDETDGEPMETISSKEAPKSSDKIRVRVKLTSAQVSLENNGDKFALLALPSADVAIILRAGTLRVAARLGSLSLADLSEGPTALPEFKKLLSIEGDELADFSYETFDPSDKETFPGYNSSVNLRAGSLKFTFMEKPMQDLYVWALKFARMKAVYDAASQAAVQRASEVTRMHYDVVIKTPIIVLPRHGLDSPDILILRLGEITAKNKYLGDPNDTSTLNASLSGISVTSQLYVEEQPADLQMVDDVTISASVKQAGGTSHRSDPHQADTEVTLHMSDVNLSLTQRQYIVLMAVLESIPRALSDIGGAADIPESMPSSAPASAPPTPASEHEAEPLVNLEPELTPIKKIAGSSPELWTSVDLEFSVSTIAFEVYTSDATAEHNLKRCSIARFALVQTHVGMKQLSDGAMEAEVSLKTLAFSNTRAGNSVFRDIIPSASHEGNQMMLQYTRSGGKDPSALAVVQIDSPRFILAVDPLAALLEFAVSPFKTQTDSRPEPELEDEEEDIKESPNPNSLAFRVEIVDSTVIVLASDSDPRTQAIQLGIKEVIVSQQGIMALKVEQLGMSFGRMDKPKDRVRFLDDVNVALSLDNRTRGSQQMTSFEVEVPDPIIFRASYNDIMLIMDIVNKAVDVANKALAPPEDTAKKPDRRRSLMSDSMADATSTAVVPTTKTTSTRRTSISKRRSGLPKSKVLVSKEQLKANFNGFQFVLVGDIHEMPMVHLSTNEFTVLINDWSGDMKMATSLTTSIRYFNLANSYFEPLMDPWNFDVRVTRSSAGPTSSPLSVRVSAAQRLELNLSSAFIELAITSMTVWSREAQKPRENRGQDAPFRIRNRTGLALLLWPEANDLNKPISGVKRLDDGADVPWRFEDRRHTREASHNVSAFRHNALGIQLQDTPWESLRGISVDREGEHILTLRPRLDKVSHQLTCEIHLDNNIKIITFRSTLNVENQTSLPVEMIVVDSHGKASQGAMRINPGESCPLPLEAAYEKRFRLRPLRGFGFDYGWSMPLHWRQLMTRPIRPISCKHQTPTEPAFFFQAQANFNAKDPAARIYPQMSLMLRAPVEVENLLPYDIKFRIHDKNMGLSSSNFLVKGGSSPIHTVGLSHLLLLSVAPEDTNLKQSDYAIINTDDPELPTENHFSLADQQDLKLILKLHYFTYPDSGGAFKVQVYSPYVFLNKTGLSFDLAAKTWTGGQKPVAGRDLFGMFSFPNEDRRNRLFLRVNDSRWSDPLSFDTVAADMQVVIQSQDGNSDTYVGLSYAEGLGKFKLTKVITIAPRFLMTNKFTHDIRVRQQNTDRVINIVPGDKQPIFELRHDAPPQLCIAFDEVNQKWSAPFSLTDIGRTHVTLERQTARGPRTYLMRLETHIQSSNIFLYVSRETEPWPLKLRNDTNLKFQFRQVSDDTSPRDCPVRDLPPHGNVEYTWDYPTASNKHLQLALDGVPVPGGIDMLAIGVQPPIRVPSRQSGKKAETVSIDIQADGSSQLLIISPYVEETSLYKPTRRGVGPVRRSDSTDSLSTTGFETVVVNEKPSLSIMVELEGIGISVITKRPDELIYMSLRGLKVGYTDYPQYYDAMLDCKWIQIDNQLFGGLFPIILYPTVVPKDGKELESHPTLQASVALLKDRSHGVIFVKYATILLQAMTVELDEDFLFALLDFVKFKDASWREPAQDVLIEHPKDIPEPDITSATADVFFEALQLQPISLELSFMRTDRVNVDEKVSTRNPFYYGLNALTMALGNVNAAPVNFRALFLENVRLSIPSLQERIVLHYQEQFMAQIYRVLGRADFLGNPVGLFNNISSGVSDIFYEPYQGMVMHGNKNIGLGIARGATSFAKKTVFGISDSMTKFTGSIGKGLSAATLDAEYQSKRRMNKKRNKPKHALYGVAAGASAFADSVTSAFEGVASKPMEGAEKDGAAGFAKGVGKGVVGLFTKPVVGVMDFVSASTEGIRNTTTVFDQQELDRVRLPRFIATDGVLRPFSAREALGQSWLKDLDAGAYFTESYVAHLDVPGDDAVAILSTNRLLFVQLRKLKVVWQVPFEELQSLSLEQTGIALTLRGGTPGPFLPISEQTGREWFFKHIGKVVVAYNKTHSQKED
ncbi:hypothetical protein TREMEDRAFT_25659 [Tremella mesenterica DSM 1558]|uniref:uncharacterized protein n=1 Tax=Tremella mesenterica (strain ATCC 24925 / CBS 8224 / DSM 1558 / NBRC 9311 / NRRL Y-6157 / RJB 2259-6 / UBC 559-6) TaxID=578456 RepID=UPI0003F49687|nr:uncharacterized protein TREMEDRAFT_25659 [Tremella mesenterica DSM 1558]EIW72804.1 hypothetical protein TREMEDRAFT_25659 [Tremella mesenterica DSM 1558]